MAESEWARNMRREAEKQTSFAGDQAHYAAQSAYSQQEAAREAMYAADAASRSEENSEALLRAQKKMSKQNRDHNFAMWRQTTNNGESYDRWLMQAQPLVDEFAGRWRQWTAAKEADISRVRALRAEQSITRFNVNTRAVKAISESKGPLKAALWRNFFVFLIFDACALGIWVVTGIGGIFNHSWWDFGSTAASYVPALLYMWIAYLAAEFLVLVPRAKRLMKASVDASTWQKTEVAAFISSLPANWHQTGDDLAWNQMVAAEKTINSMPKIYIEFTPQMLIDLGAGQPTAGSSSAIHPEAERTRALLDLWTAKPVSPIHSVA